MCNNDYFYVISICKSNTIAISKYFNISHALVFKMVVVNIVLIKMINNDCGYLDNVRYFM